MLEHTYDTSTKLIQKVANSAESKGISQHNFFKSAQSTVDIKDAIEAHLSKMEKSQKKKAKR